MTKFCLLVAVGIAMSLTACGSSGHSSTNSSSAAGGRQTQAQTQAAFRFAGCMRTHGVPGFPDPTTRAFKFSLTPASGNAQSPTFRSAVTACRHLLPDGGPGNESPARRQAQIAAGLAFARCLRTHGFPNFPDPTSSGQLTPEMVTQAGINLHQPAVLQAADGCVSVTHGFLTKAAIARAVNGGGD
ncbi:MAG: hypothetical protein ACTHMY_17205 [Solirubrobacteraceae bacterium]